MLAKLNRFKPKQSISDLTLVLEVADKVDEISRYLHKYNTGDVLLFKSELLLDALLTSNKTN